jgi:O-acetylserine/cysteine efflux transporter
MKLSDLLLVLTMCIFWATDYIVTKGALFTVKPIFLSVLRFGVVAFCMLPFCRRIPVKHIGSLFILSFVLVVLTYGFGDIGIDLNSSVTVANLIIETNVIVSVIFAAVFLKEKLTTKAISGVIVAFLGVILVILGNSLDILDNIVVFNKSNILSFCALLFTIMSWPVYAIWSKKLENDLSTVEIIAWTAFLGTIQGMIVSLIFETGQLEAIKSIDLNLIGLVLYAGIGGIIVPHKILHYLIRTHNVGTTMTFSLLVPVICAIESFFIFDDELSISIIFGGVLVLYGVYLTNFSKKPELLILT